MYLNHENGFVLLCYASSLDSFLDALAVIRSRIEIFDHQRHIDCDCHSGLVERLYTCI